MFCLRILFISSQYPPYATSGLCTHVYNLTRALAHLGCEVHLVTYGPTNANKRINGVHVHFLKSSKIPVGKEIVFSLSSTKKISKLCRDFAIELVHGQSPASFGYGLMRDHKLPYVVTMHGTSFGEIDALLKWPTFDLKSLKQIFMVHPFYSALTWIEYKQADKLIAVSQAIAQEATRFYHLKKEKIIVISNGADSLNEFSTKAKIHTPPEKQGAYTILFVGRLTRRKGAAYLIKAMPQILDNFPDTMLYIVGEGEQRSNLQNVIMKLKIGNHVKFLGKVSQSMLYSLYSRVNVYVHPSLYEPFSIAILEAMNMGIPVAVTRTGGSSEIITHGKNGLLIDPGNSSQLASAVKEIFSNTSLSREFAQQAMNTIKIRYTWEKIAQETLKLYESVLQERSLSSLEKD